MTETDTLETIGAFIARAGVTMGVTRVPATAEDKRDWPADASHWRCRLVARDDGAQETRDVLSVAFHQGSAHKAPPTLADVLDCLASDAASVDNARDFEDWAAELGFDADSRKAERRKAERTYRLCMEQSIQLRRLLGGAAYEDLLYRVERL